MAAFSYPKDRGLTGVWFAVATALFTLAQYSVVEADGLSATMNLLALAVAAFSAWIFSHRKSEGKAAFAFVLVMGLFITSAYVREFSDNVFAVTIYLAFVSAGLLFWGISADSPKFRTAGLYV